MTQMYQRRRVVVTGVGVISPSGNTVEEFWKNVTTGVSASAPIERFDTKNLPVKIGAEVKDFDISHYGHKIKEGRLDRTIQYGIAAATLALQDSGLRLKGLDTNRIAVMEGTTISGADSILKSHTSFRSGGNSYRAIHPYNIVAGYCGEGSSMISFYLGIKGPAMTYCSGCASGADAIGYAAKLVEHDEVDIALAGGSEEMVEMLHVGFCKLRAMSEHNDDPPQAMRPFDKTRDGFVLGEGSAFLVLEELSHALARGARIYAEVLGHGRRCEAYHATDPHPEGIGYVQSMEEALRRARISPSGVDYLNAHGSATRRNDPVETLAIKRVFGPGAGRLAISATKPITGHLMGASGAIEAAICVLTIDRQQIPPTINLRDPDEECDLNYVRETRSYPVKVAMNLNAGFGGRYACLIFAEYPQ
jgi:3-oxoacyl-[acyl-carrier-protein] synthase II